MTTAEATEQQAARAGGTAMAVLAAISFSHMLNDMMQSMLPAIYPMLKDSLALDFGQIGLVTLAFQLTASLLQPLVGLYTDRRPQPYSLAVGMAARSSASFCWRWPRALRSCCWRPRWSVWARRSSRQMGS